MIHYKNIMFNPVRPAHGTEKKAKAILVTGCGGL
jgi:hypothetical protein